MSEKKLDTAEVIDNEDINKLYFRLSLRLLGIKGIKAGQFINLKIEKTMPASSPKPAFELSDYTDLKNKTPFLMRPFSVGRILTRGEDFIDAEFLIKEVGIGTYILRHLGAGSKLNYLGPLGSGFKIDKGTKTAILIGGGTGFAPLMALADLLTANNVKSYLIVGGIDKDNLPVNVSKKEEKLKGKIPSSDFVVPGMESEYCITGVATDDGSIGFKGFVTDLAESILNSIVVEKKEEVCIFSCGPLPMMKSAQGMAEKFGLAHQVSLERYMACGLGVCLSCVNKIKRGGGWEHLRVCTEGPVFNAGEVIFHE